MAGTGASGKTRSDLARAGTTVALVANERAGSNEAARCAERLRAFGAEVMRFDVDEVEDAVASGADRVVVAGGDGSIAPVGRRGGCGRAFRSPWCPAGTANDFARRLGLPDSLTAACRLAVHGTKLRGRWSSAG